MADRAQLVLNNTIPATDKDLLEAGAAFMGGSMSLDRRFEIAEILCRSALALNNENDGAMANLATLCLQKKQYEEARGFAARAVALNPDKWGPWVILGQIYGRLGKFLEARMCVSRSTELDPNQFSTWFTLAGLWEIEGNAQEAEVCYQKSLVLKPDDPEVKYCWGMVKMLRGDYAYGLPLYECRWQRFTTAYPITRPMDLLAGRDINGEIVIEAEQGHGDLFMMARYAKTLKSKGHCRTITLHCADSVADLMKRFTDIDLVVSYSKPWTPRPQATISALSFPYFMMLLGESIWQPPAKIDTSGLTTMSFGARGPVVSFCRAGNPLHPNDRFRSISEADFEPLLIKISKNGWRFDLSAGSWEDSIRHMLASDLVITVDTAAAHLSGSLGKRTWLLVSSVPDWRWGSSTETTAWYPSIRIFRQEKPLEWKPVIDRVVKELGDL